MRSPDSQSSDVQADVARHSGGHEPFALQGQHRLDVRLRDELSACFCANPDLDVGSVKVTVARGSVILEGIAPSHVVRTRIVDLVSSCAAVVLIRSSIRVADH